MKVHSAVILGIALPVCAFLAFTGTALTGRNAGAVPLIALAAWLSVSVATPTERAAGEGRRTARIFFVALLITCLVLAAVRLAL